MSQDPNLLPTHISMYMALFQVWNENRFQNPISIVRAEVMQASKINSFSTYTRSLRELHMWRYIEYLPSHNPALGTRVNLYDFCNSNCKSDCNTSVTETVIVKAVIPYSNIYKQYKESKQENTPTVEAVLFFFKEKKMGPEEAKKFFNHYQATGWLMGGKAPIKDWQAAAEKWISNVDKFNTPTTNSKPKPSNLHAGNDKDYSEPL